MRDALLIFEQQRQKNITGMQSVGNDVPMPHDQIQEILQFLLTGEGVLIGLSPPQISGRYSLGRTLAGQQISAAKNPSRFSRFMPRWLRKRLRTLPKRSYSVSVSGAFVIGCLTTC